MEYGDFVRVKKTKEIGYVTTQTKDRVSVVIDEQEKHYLKTSVEVIEKIHLSENDLRNIFRLNMSYMDMYEDIALASNYDYQKPYMPTVDDLLAMAMNLKIAEVTIGQFLSALFEINVILKPCYIPQKKSNSTRLENVLLSNEADLFEYVFGVLDVNDLPIDDLVADYIDVEEVISLVSNFKKNIGKPLLERVYTDVIKLNFLAAVQDDDLYDELDDEYTEMFKSFINELVEKNELEAVEILGYCYYGGNALYPCDWAKSRDLFEKVYAVTGEPDIANSLGYIYYAGRCNNGVGEYEKAFKYFSIGAASGIYESKYKLADMFKNGYFVTRNIRVAEDIYNELYEENLKIFSKGFFDCKLADIALRLGGLYMDRKQYPAAYYFLLEADFAIRKRTANYNYYGDLSVFDSIQQALETCKRNEKFETLKYALMGSLDILKLFFSDHHKVRFEAKELSGKKVRLKATRLPFKDEFSAYCLMSLVSFNGCVLTDSLTVMAQKVESCHYRRGFEATSMEVYGNRICFYNDEEMVYYIEADNYRIDNPITEYPENEYRFISVKVNDETKDYLCDDINVYSGQSVMVEVNGKKEKGIVVKSYIRNQEMLKKPLESYTGFIKKIEF